MHFADSTYTNHLRVSMRKINKKMSGSIINYSKNQYTDTAVES